MSLIFKGISNILSEINPPPPFSLPSGSSDSPTPMAPEGRAVVRMGGWVGGEILVPLIFLKIGYNNKQDVLIPNMASKVVYGH